MILFLPNLDSIKDKIALFISFYLNFLQIWDMLIPQPLLDQIPPSVPHAKNFLDNPGL